MALSPEDLQQIVAAVVPAVMQQISALGADDLPPEENADDPIGDDDNPDVHVHVHDGEDDDDPEQFNAAASATDGEIPDGMAMDRYGRMYRIAPQPQPDP